MGSDNGEENQKEIHDRAGDKAPSALQTMFCVLGWMRRRSFLNLRFP